MKHMLAAYLIVTLMVGATSLVVLFLAWRRQKSKALLYYSIICACLTVSVLINLTMFYFGINISSSITKEMLILLLAGSPVSYLMQFFIPLMAHEVTGVKWARKGNWAVVGLMAAQISLCFSPWFIKYEEATGSVEFLPGFMIQNVLLIAFIVYAVVLGLARWKGLTESLRKLVKNFAIVTILFLPGLAYDQSFVYRMGSMDQIPVTVIFFPLYFLTISVGNIFYAVRYLMSPSAVQGALAGLSLEEAVAKVATERDLTDREREIALLVAKGLGNKQIAASLSISAKTVNNHVYNCYQKLGINSRFELMALLNAESRPD